MERIKYKAIEVADEGASWFQLTYSGGVRKVLVTAEAPMPKSKRRSILKRPPEDYLRSIMSKVTDDQLKILQLRLGLSGKVHSGDEVMSRLNLTNSTYTNAIYHRIPERLTGTERQAFTELLRKTALSRPRKRK